MIKSLKSESLKLYRDILRATKLFTWPNEKGQLWSEILRINARKEFEQAKHENDPQIITKLLFVGRDCMNQTTERYLKAAKKIADDKDEKNRKQ